MSARPTRFALIALLTLSGAAPAQDKPETSAPAPAAAQPAAPAPEVSLEMAYKKEFAFLEAQKRELSARIATVKREFERDRQRLEGEVSALEGQALAAQSRAEALVAELVKADQLAQANADNRETLQATFDQARSTLESLDVPGLGDAAFVEQDDANKLQEMFGHAQQRLAALSSIQRGPGNFFLADGSEAEGTIVRFGNVAAFGVSDEAAGALAPAGGGAFRLWNQPAELTARALGEGKLPAMIDIFLFENANLAIAEPEKKTIWNEVKKGGLIGFIILGLGSLAMLLVVLRAAFLKQAGASISGVLDAVAPAMQANRIDDAIAAAKQFKGSAARVVTAALRGIQQALGDDQLDRTEREHLEDIVSESILHESTPLSRFGGVIMMIAAVAPLLGLLGTVTGMIQTFDVITEFGTSDPKLLSGGIATALVTTELGLIVAIPCLLFGNLLNGWSDRIKDDMEKAALRAINLYQGNVARVNA